MGDASMEPIGCISGLLANADALREQLANGQRQQLMGMLSALLRQLERPDEAVFRVTFNEPSHYLAIRLGVQWSVFETLGDIGSPPQTSSQLAEVPGADSRLVARFLRHLAANGTIREVDLDTFAATRFSSWLRTKSFQDAVEFMWDDFYNVAWKVPSFLDSISHRNPEDIDNGPYQHAVGVPNKSMYTLFDENREMGARFGGMIQMYNAGKSFFWEEGYYPISERLANGGPLLETDVLLVDIGGGDGDDLGKLRKARPDLTGRLILQELAHIVDRSSQDGFEAQIGDWNRVQPVKDAQFYMLQHVLHDFSSDEACRKILRNTIPAMKRGYSKILIKELIVPDRNAPWPFTALDVNVMQSLSGQERTESQWRVLLESVGLKIEGIWMCDTAIDGVIEATCP